MSSLSLSDSVSGSISLTLSLTLPLTFSFSRTLPLLSLSLLSSRPLSLSLSPYHRVGAECVGGCSVIATATSAGSDGMSVRMIDPIAVEEGVVCVGAMMWV